MDQQYAELNLDHLAGSEDYVVTTAEGREERVLAGLGTVNLFVGPNNAGKSRFLRALYRADKFVYRASGFERGALGGLVKQFAEQVKSALSGNVVGYGPIRDGNHFLPFADFDWFTEGENRVRDLLTHLNALINNTAFSPTYKGGYGVPSEDQARAIHARLVGPAQQLVQRISSAVLSIGSEPRVYIPVLRGLRPVGPEDEKGRRPDVYGERTKHDYDLAKAKGQVFTGLAMYEDLRGLLLGKRDARKRVETYEAFLKDHVFEGRAVELTPQQDGDVVHLDIDGEEERPIYSLGDGIQALIIMTFPAFAAEKRSLFFIEEPDTHLHPGMQRKVLELFLNNENLKRHQVFMTTHSNHLLDMASDYSDCTTFLFRKEPTKKPPFRIRSVSQADRLVLDELGARASSVFLTNATIWVEGISDRLYLREYLQKYLRENKLEGVLREDTHFSFMEGGGSNIAHFDFESASGVEEMAEQIRVARVCSRSFVVLDGDNEGKPRLIDLRAALDQNLFVLKSKEVENLLPVDVISAYARNRLKSIANTTLLKLEHYHELKTPLGKVLDEKLQVDVFTEDQTIKNKSGVCTFCVEFMRDRPGDWKLTPEAERLCRALVTFIAGENGLTLPVELTEQTPA